LGQSLGETRIFSKAMSMIVPALALTLGRALVLDEPRRKLFYFGAAGLLSVEILIEFTRANYLGLIAALVVGAILLTRMRTDHPQSRSTVALVGAGTIAMGLWFASGTTTFQKWLGSSTVVARFSSASADVSALGGTFGYRLGLYQLTNTVIEGRWLTGVGFWHPEEHYVVSLPQGSIRNNDTGILATYATMGVVGVGLLLWIVVTVGKWAVSSLQSRLLWVQATSWATAAYIVWIALTSFSLGFLAHGAGLMATAIIVGVMTGARHADVGQTVEAIS
jgi:hypothetical protein